MKGSFGCLFLWEIVMTFNNKSLHAIFTSYRTIAIVGLSNKTSRPSFNVAQYMQAHGYRIIPINPTYAGQEILGESCFATLDEASAQLKRQGAPIDIVDCFRKSVDIPPIADAAIHIGAKCLWLQMGIVHQEAEQNARNAGLDVVSDRCIKIDHALWQSTQGN
jgi:predicted CoA-binding protein